MWEVFNYRSGDTVALFAKEHEAGDYVYRATNAGLTYDYEDVSLQSARLVVENAYLGGRDLTRRSH